jgi:hypothetical protein
VIGPAKPFSKISNGEEPHFAAYPHHAVTSPQRRISPDHGQSDHSKRADDHARSLVEELRKEIFGSEDREANDRFWLEPEAITLKALTSHLIERGFKPPLQSGKLTLSMVDRAFKRAGVDWREWRTFLTSNKVSLIAANGLVTDAEQTRTAANLAIRLRRRSEASLEAEKRLAILKGYYNVQPNGKKIATLTGVLKVRLQRIVNEIILYDDYNLTEPEPDYIATLVKRYLEIHQEMVSATIRSNHRS